MTNDETRTAALAAIAAANVVISKVNEGGYTSVQLLEADVATVRASIQALLPWISKLWGAIANPALVNLRSLADRLLDLRPLVDDAMATVELVTERETSLVELAVKYYGDFSRWTDLVALNPNLRDPSLIPAGTVLVRHVS